MSERTAHIKTAQAPHGGWYFSVQQQEVDGTGQQSCGFVACGGPYPSSDEACRGAVDAVESHEARMLAGDRANNESKAERIAAENDRRALALQIAAQGRAEWRS